MMRLDQSNLYYHQIRECFRLIKRNMQIVRAKLEIKSLKKTPRNSVSD